MESYQLVDHANRMRSSYLHRLGVWRAMFSGGARHTASIRFSYQGRGCILQEIVSYVTLAVFDITIAPPHQEQKHFYRNTLA